MNKYSLLFLLLVYTSFANAQAVNDECINAATLQVNADTSCSIATTGTVEGATASIEANSCSGSDDDDVWYQFVATSTVHKIQLLNIAGSTTNLNHVLYEGNDCGTLIQKYCSDPNNSTATNLIVGQTYKIRVYSASQAAQTTSFTICVSTPAPPVNDNCDNALPLIVNTSDTCASTTTGSLHLATVSPQSFLCSGSAGEDVWYEFVATSSSIQIDITNTGPIDPIKYAVYSGSCDALTSKKCGSTSGVINNLTIGETYKLRIYSWAGAAEAVSSFTICLKDVAPVNDECSNASVLTVNEGVGCIQSAPGTFLNANGTSSNNYDVWYEFTATSTAHAVYIASVNGTASITHRVYSGNCEALTEIYYKSGTSSGYASFVVGQTYKVKVNGSGTGGQNTSFNICVNTPASPPLNDNCSLATVVPVNADQTCSASVEGTVLFTTASSQPFLQCSGSADDDVWYRFTATSNKHIITLSNFMGSTTGLYYEVTAGTDCNFSQPLVGCNTQNQGIHTFVPGQIYTIRVYSGTATTGQTTAFNLCITTPPPAPISPSNDACDAATVITVSAGLDCTQVTEGTLYGATASSQSNSCFASSVEDVWFEFTATNNIHVISFPTTNEQALRYGLFEGTCFSPQELLCVYDSSSAIASGLIPGQTYKIRVYRGGTAPVVNTPFTICVATPPPSPINDECSSATLLSVNSYASSCTQSATGTLYWSTVSANTNSTCFENNEDIWFEFQATDISHRIEIFDIEGFNNIAYEILGGSCGTLTNVYCTSTVNSQVVAGLTPGHFYKIRVIHYQSSQPATTFSICVKDLHPAPANDECTGAVVLSVNPGMENTQVTQATLTSATSSPEPGECASVSSPDVWFEFTASQPLHILSTSGMTAIINKEIYSGDCGDLVQMDCYPLDNMYLQNLIPGQSYKIRIIGNGFPSSGGFIADFAISILTPPASPANDECVNATVLPVNNSLECTNFVTATSTSATTSVQFIGGNDIWFQFVATNPIHYLNFTNVNGAIVNNRYLYSGSCGDLTLVKTLNQTPQNYISGLTIGETYTLLVTTTVENAQLGQPNSFDVCLTTPPIPSNDNCTNATPLTINPDLNCSIVTQGSLQGATPSAEPHTCNGAADDDVWYSFTATSASHLINVYNLGTTGTIRVNVFEGNSCDTMTLLSCGPNNTTPYVIGQTYFVRVYSLAQQTTVNAIDFTICIGTPVAPANDECINASVITVNNDYTCTLESTGNLQAATHSTESSSCASSNHKDVWFEFAATSTMHEINVRYINGTGAPGMTIYTGTCSALTQILCASTSTTPYARYLTGLTIGETYKIRVQANLSSDQALTFGICIKTPIVPANDDCVNAMVVPVNETTACSQSASGTLYASTVSPEANNCVNALGGDVWFQFTATSSKHVFQFTNTSIDVKFSIYSSETCGSGQIACNLSTTTANGVSINNLSVGNTYKVRIFTVNVQVPPINFDICITTPEVTCPEAIPFISGYDSYVFESAVNTPSVPENIACLLLSPNPQYFSIEIDAPGDLLFEVSGNTAFDPYGTPTGTPRDVDYVIWGPFLNLNEACDNLNNSTAIDCGYSSSAVENMLIPNGQTGEFYIVMITNFNGGAGFTKFQQVGGTGTVEVEAPTGDSVQEFEPGVTLGDLVVEGENIQWYEGPGGSAGRSDNPENGNNDTPLPLSTPVVSGVTYYASQTKYGIESIMRLAVTVYLTTDTPEIDEISDLFICSDNEFTLVNLTTVTPEVLGELSADGYTVTFHHNEIDAQNGLVEIESPESYTTTIPGSEPIFVRVTEIANPGNFAVTTFNILVEHLEISDPTVYAICEPATDGFAAFDLTTKTTEITGDCIGCTITYYTDAAGTNAIADPANFMNIVSPQTVYAVVTSANGCAASTALTLEVLNAPAIISFPVIYTCGEEYDLTENESLYSNSYVLSYHTTQNDAHNSSDAITNTTAYTGLGSVWIRIENPVSSCYIVTEQTLMVNEVMSASLEIDGQTITVVMASNGNYQYRLDDGEYQEENIFTGVSYGTHNIAVQDGCNNILASTVNVVPDAPIGESIQSFIQGETLVNLDVTGLGILWYESSTGGEPLNPDTPLVDGTTYYASQTINGVESTERLAVTANLSLNTHDNAFKGFALYPNPVQDIVNIINSNDIEEIIVYNILGQQLYMAVPKTNNTQIDMSHYMQGVYLLTIKSAGHEKTVKLQKK